MNSKVLEKFNRSLTRVKFDPYNPTHMVAAKELVFEYKQHGDYRFNLEDGFESVPQMMLHRIAQKALIGGNHGV